MEHNSLTADHMKSVFYDQAIYEQRRHICGRATFSPRASGSVDIGAPASRVQHLIPIFISGWLRWRVGIIGCACEVRSSLSRYYCSPNGRPSGLCGRDIGWMRSFRLNDYLIRVGTIIISLLLSLPPCEPPFLFLPPLPLTILPQPSESPSYFAPSWSRLSIPLPTLCSTVLPFWLSYFPHAYLPYIIIACHHSSYFLRSS